LTTINGFPVPSFETVTPVGLYILLVLLLYFERIVPIGRVKSEQKTTDYWRETAEKKDAAIAKLTETNHLLTKEIGETVAKVMGEIQAKAGVDS
jgi:hypothetical protein